MSQIESALVLVLVLVPRRGCLSLGGRAGDAGAAVRSAALFEEMTVGGADAAVLSIVKWRGSDQSEASLPFGNLYKTSFPGGS